MGLSEKINEIKKLVEQINVLTQSLLGNDNCFFKDSHLEFKEKNSFEHSFIRSISWFYSLYFELASTNLVFMKSIMKSYGYSTGNYLDLIHALRTYYQHHLNPNNSNDLDKINTVLEFYEQANGGKPNCEESWEICLDKLLDDSTKFLNNILQCLEQIKDDEFKEIIIKDWINKRERALSFTRVREVFEAVSTKLDLGFYDSKRICNKNYENWMQEIKNFDKSVDLNTALNKVIEKELSQLEYIPVDGNDIMEYFNIGEGKAVREHLRLAHQIFKEEPCSKNELLSKIQSKKNRKK